MITTRASKLDSKLPETLARLVENNMDDWRASGKVARLWQGNASLWTGTDEANWLG